MGCALSVSFHQCCILISYQINQPTRCSSFSSLLLDVYVQLNMFRASSRPSSWAQQLQQPEISAGERPAAVHLLRSWVRIPPGAWIFVCCECRVLSGRGLCDELITRPEESYRLWSVVLCNLETSRMGAPYTYDISSLRVNDLTHILLTWRKSWTPNNASKQQMGFNSAFEGLNEII